jgi:leader peptidase (prepilin peptidase)/N-methyltransferase
MFLSDVAILFPVFLFGLIIGSFINVCIWRLPREESVVFPASHCPACNKPIRPYDNIPVFSYLLLRGRCRACKAAISWRYPLVELLHGVLAVYVVHRFGLAADTALWALFLTALMAIVFIDIDHQIIPDVITLPGMVIGLVASSTILDTGWANAIVGLLLGGGLFYAIAILSERILKREGMGGGDIKLIAMIGAFLGWRPMLLTLFLAALAGSLIGLILIWRGRDRSEPIPFGPFLSFGAMVALFWGEAIFEWYARYSASLLSATTGAY